MSFLNFYKLSDAIWDKYHISLDKDKFSTHSEVQIKKIINYVEDEITIEDRISDIGRLHANIFVFQGEKGLNGRTYQATYNPCDKIRLILSQID